jgi:phytol kinase
MFAVIGTLAFVFATLLLNEYLWKKKILKGEGSRKFMHILIGSYGAFWPFFLSWNEILFISILAIGFMVFMRTTHIFHSVYSVRRKSMGDFVAPATLGILAIIEPTKLVFAAAVLHIALADGLAAVIGTRYGKKNAYRVLWNKKSIAGTATFIIVSFNILIWLFVRGEVGITPITLPALFIIPFAAAYIENVAPWGSDNLFVPLTVIGLLGTLQIVV